MPCFYCGQSLKGGKRTRDHVVPKCKGGTYDRIVDACKDCNQRKAALDLEEFRVVFWGAHVRKFWGEA